MYPVSCANTEASFLGVIGFLLSFKYPKMFAIKSTCIGVTFRLALWSSRSVVVSGCILFDCGFLSFLKKNYNFVLNQLLCNALVSVHNAVQSILLIYSRGFL